MKSDEFRQQLKDRLHGDVILFNHRQDGFLLKRISVGDFRLSVVSSPEQCFAISNLSEKHLALLIFPLDSTEFFFNGHLLTPSKIGLCSSVHIAGLHAEQNSLWGIVEFTKQMPKLDLICSATVPIELKPELLGNVKAQIVACIDAGHHSTDPLEQMLRDVVSQIESLSPPMRPVNQRGRSRVSRKHILRQAMFLMCHGEGSQQVSEKVTAQYHISERSYRDMFKQAVGISPKRFSLLLQLYQFRDHLLEGQHRRVSEVADLLDLSERGRLAARYKTHFGELPSATLGK